MKVRLTYVLMTLAIFAVIIAGAAVVSVGVAESPVATTVCVVCLLVSAILLRYEWARDRRAAAMYGFFFTAATSIACASVVAMFVGSAQWIAAAAGVCALGAAAWLGVVLWRERRLDDLLPDWLLAEFPDGPIFEDDGVQWCVQSEGSDLSEGVTVRVYLQNNIEATREVNIRLRDESGMLSRSGRITCSRIDPLRLPARAHAIVRVSVSAASKHRIKALRLYTSVDASGPPARRNRRLRAEPGPRPTPKWLVVLGPLAGAFTLSRGGVFLSLTASGGSVVPRGLATAEVTLVAS